VVRFWQDFALGFRKVPHLNTVNKYMFWCLYLLHGGLKKCNKYGYCACVQGWVKHNHWIYRNMVFLQIHNTNTVKHLKQSAVQWCEVLWEWNYSLLYTVKHLYFRFWKKRMFTYNRCFLIIQKNCRVSFVREIERDYDFINFVNLECVLDRWKVDSFGLCHLLLSS
jgi:hypothetical protein